MLDPKNYSGAKHSNAYVTSDYESVTLLNLLPQQQKSIGHATDGDNSGIHGNIDVQETRVQDNHGITGITGTGHTINVYQYPKGLDDLLLKILMKVSL
jgi:hypothetical protein